jgi:uncharacterized protein
VTADDLPAQGLSLRGFVQLVIAQYRLSVDGVHGVAHWGRVLENGRRLAPLTGADLRVIELFSIFHDACRHRDGIDPDHGPRGAALALAHRGEIELDDRGLDLLVEACECHTRGPRRGADVTVLACLDADRLDIPRVGMQTRPELLFTSAARERRMIGWAGARAALGERPLLCAEEWGWSDL